MNLENYIKDLSPELQEKARACGSVEELLALAKEEKVPVPDEALETIAGGNGAGPVGCKKAKKVTCPKCGSTNVTILYWSNWGKRARYTCYECKYEWSGDA